MDLFNKFYVHIEDIQGNHFKIKYIEPIKYDDEHIIHDDSQFFENSAEDGFDDISIDNDYFDNDDGN